MAGNQHEGKKTVENKNGAGKTCKPIAEQQQTDDDDGGKNRNNEDVDNVLEAGVAPHTPIKAKDIERRNLDAQDKGEKTGKLPQNLIVKMQFKTNRIGQKLRQHDQNDIETENEPEFGIPHQISKQSALREYFVETGRIHKFFPLKALIAPFIMSVPAKCILSRVHHTIFL